MDHAVIQPALVQWVRTLAGLTDTATTKHRVQWQDEAPVFGTADGATVLLSWVSRPVVGTDETRYEDNEEPAPTPNMVPVQVGHRLPRVQVSFETLDQRPAGNASTLAERLRDRATRPSSLEALEAANLGFVRAGDLRDAPYRGDGGRIRARTLLEVTFTATSFDRDTAGAVPSIETIEVTSAVTTPTGALVAPASLQLDDEVMP